MSICGNGHFERDLLAVWWCCGGGWGMGEVSDLGFLFCECVEVEAEREGLMDLF